MDQFNLKPRAQREDWEWKSLTQVALKTDAPLSFNEKARKVLQLKNIELLLLNDLSNAKLLNPEHLKTYTAVVQELNIFERHEGMIILLYEAYNTLSPFFAQVTKTPVSSIQVDKAKEDGHFVVEHFHRLTDRFIKCFESYTQSTCILPIRLQQLVSLFSGPIYHLSCLLQHVHATIPKRLTKGIPQPIADQCASLNGHVKRLATQLRAFLQQVAQREGEIKFTAFIPEGPQSIILFLDSEVNVAEEFRKQKTQVEKELISSNKVLLARVTDFAKSVVQVLPPF